MAENATTPGSEVRARDGEESTLSASTQEVSNGASAASDNDGKGRGREPESKNDVGSAVAQSLAQLEPRQVPVKPASEDVAASLDALAEGVSQAAQGDDANGKKAGPARKAPSRKAAGGKSEAKAAAGTDGAPGTQAKGGDAGTQAREAAGAQDQGGDAARKASRADEPEANGSQKKRGRSQGQGDEDGAGQAQDGRGKDERSKGGAVEPTSAFTPQFSSAEEISRATAPAIGMTALLFQEPDMSRVRTRKRGSAAQDADGDAADDTPAKRVRTRKSATDRASAREVDGGEDQASQEPAAEADGETSAETRRRRRGTRGRRKNADNGAAKSAQETGNSDSSGSDEASGGEEATTTRRRRRRSRSSDSVASDEVTVPKGSTRLEAKRQRRKEGREAGRRRQTITESEYLARRESVKREMIVREQDGLNQIAVLEDDVLVEHYVARHTQVSMVGNVYLGRVQNVLPSMEAAFVDIGKGRNAVLYAGEVNWEAAGLEGKPRRIEQALKSGDVVLVQVTKDPIGHKGARLTAQVTLAGRHLVLVPSGAMTGISRKLPDRERQRLKRLLRELVPAEHGVIVRTAAEGASEEQLRADVDRLTKTWEDIQAKAKNTKAAPMLLKGEPELAVRVVRDIFNEDFLSLKVQGKGAWQTISQYVGELSPELTERLVNWTDTSDVFAKHRVDEQLAKAFDRKVWLPSGGTLIIDRTEAMTVIDVNTGKFTGAGGTLEETVTRNNLEAAEEIVRQLRLRDIGGIIVIDFIDMVLEANRDLVLRRLIECLGRDRTRHQVAEVTSLGLVQMTRKRVGQGLVEAFSTTCDACDGRGFITHTHPVERNEGTRDSGRRKNRGQAKAATESRADDTAKRGDVKAALNSIAAAAASKHGDEAEHANPTGHSAQAETSSGEVGAGGRNGDVGDAKAGGARAGDAKTGGVKSDNAKAGGKATSSDAAGDGGAAEAASGDAEPARGSRGKKKPGASGARARKAGQASAETGESSEVSVSGDESASAKRRAVGKSSQTAGEGASTSGEAGGDAPDGEAQDAEGTRGSAASGSSEGPAKARKRRVSSSGTIAPASSATTAILTFPAQS
ncbi:MAG: Rne/Rng family ribonuclease [Actinomycetaceae bacterium]|nr:Rne/Rng family ribonuclease [Actinomycetaceae bacterium]